MNKFELREKYRNKWENIVINKINNGWTITEAEYHADDYLMEQYGYEENEEEE
jgi:hypothetical protein